MSRSKARAEDGEFTLGPVGGKLAKRRLRRNMFLDQEAVEDNKEDSPDEEVVTEDQDRDDDNDLEVIGEETRDDNSEGYTKFKNGFLKKYEAVAEKIVNKKDADVCVPTLKKYLGPSGLEGSIYSDRTVNIGKPFYTNTFSSVKIHMRGVQELQANLTLMKTVYNSLMRGGKPKPLKLELGNKVTLLLSDQYAKHMYLTDWGQKGVTTAKISFDDDEIKYFITFIEEDISAFFDSLSE